MVHRQNRIVRSIVNQRYDIGSIGSINFGWFIPAVGILYYINGDKWKTLELHSVGGGKRIDWIAGPDSNFDLSFAEQLL